MHRTRNTLQLIVVGLALALPMLAAPAAQAQSVKGSGELFAAGFGAVLQKFNVKASLGPKGIAGGSIQITTTVWHYNIMPGDGGNTSTTTRESYSVVSLSVTGNYATIWARAESDQTLYEFFVIDNGDGSVEPDRFWGDGIYASPYLTKGNLTVTP